jgi:hypothetical protein
VLLNCRIKDCNDRDKIDEYGMYIKEGPRISLKSKTTWVLWSPKFQLPILSCSHLKSIKNLTVYSLTLLDIKETTPVPIVLGPWNDHISLGKNLESWLKYYHWFTANKLNWDRISHAFRFRKKGYRCSVEVPWKGMQGLLCLNSKTVSILLSVNYQEAIINYLMHI